MKADSTKDGVPHEVAGTAVEGEEADKTDAAVAAVIHLQTTWQMQDVEMGNKYSNWEAILASQEWQSPRPCSHNNSHEQHTFQIYTIKRYNNWNVCYSCGFDVEDGHTSMTCPFQKACHQMGFTRENVSSILRWGTHLALRECTSWSSQQSDTPDGVGQTHCC